MQPEAGANQQLAAEPKSRTGRKTGKRVNEVAGQDRRPCERNSRKRRPLRVRERPLRVNGPVLEK